MMLIELTFTFNTFTTINNAKCMKPLTFNKHKTSTNISVILITLISILPQNHKLHTNYKKKKKKHFEEKLHNSRA